VANSPDSVAPSAEADGAVSRAPQAPRRRPRTSRVKAPPAIPEASVAALIIAFDQARRIAATVRAARAIPGVDLVLVVDDGSTDNTQDLARKAGAVVVRHSHHRGRTVAVETGASVIAMRDEPGRTPRAVLLLDGGLGNYAIGAAPLVPTVTESVADLAVALTGAGVAPQGFSSTAARRAIERSSQWVPREPLSRIRCITREALEAAMPLARGQGMEVGMTLDVLHAGFTVTEVECEIHHKPAVQAKRPGGRRFSRLRDVQLAIGARRARIVFSNTTGAVANALPFRGDSTDVDNTDAAAPAAVADEAPVVATVEKPPTKRPPGKAAAKSPVAKAAPEPVLPKPTTTKSTVRKTAKSTAAKTNTKAASKPAPRRPRASPVNKEKQ